MMGTTKIVFFMILLYATVSAQHAQEYNSHPTVKKSEIKNYNFEKGVYDRQFKLTNGKKWNYQISIPTLEKGKNVPLILALHWAGGGNTYKEYSNCLAFPALEFLNAIIIAPSANGGHWIDPINEERIVALVKDIKKHWPINDAEIIVTGYSNGGIGSWHYAKNHPGLFAAAIPMAGFYKEDKLNVPLYIIHGKKDELFNVNKITADINSAIILGSKIKYEVIPDLSHYEACSYGKALARMAKLMQKEVLNK